ncbi:MAG: NUDIX domain-containing protein [Candidatus Bathyarchaeia archaeon]
MKRRFQTVTCILTWNGLLLLLKRSSRVNINPGLWCGVAGRIEDDMSPEETAYKEILEETGLQRESIEPISSAPPILVEIDDENEALVYPFLFRTENPNIRLDWEHTDYRWVRPEMVDKFETVPRFRDVMNALHLMNSKY